MPKTHGIGDSFWHKIRLQKDAPRHHQYATYEYEPPSRVAYSHVFRILGKWGIVVGRWHSQLDEDVAAIEAVKGHPTEITEEVGDRVRNYGWLLALEPDPIDYTFVGYDGTDPEPTTGFMAVIK
jgi:hypothetical protein